MILVVSTERLAVRLCYVLFLLLILLVARQLSTIRAVTQAINTVAAVQTDLAAGLNAWGQTAGPIRSLITGRSVSDHSDVNLSGSKSNLLQTSVRVKILVGLVLDLKVSRIVGRFADVVIERILKGNRAIIDYDRTDLFDQANGLCYCRESAEVLLCQVEVFHLLWDGRENQKVY